MVMHDATEVVWYSQWVDIITAYFPKIIFTSRKKILWMNGDIFISVWPALLMPEANYMTNFMNYASKWTLRANVDWLYKSKSSNVRTASVKNDIM